MNIIKRFLLLMMFLLIAGCSNTTNNDQTDDLINKITDPVKRSVAYGIVNNDYIGIVEVVKANNMVIQIEIDEAFLPNVWAKETELNSLKDYLEDEAGFRYAKYITIGDIQFTGAFYSEAELNNIKSTKQYIKYSSDKIEDLYIYLQDENNAKWYIEKINIGQVYVSLENKEPNLEARCNPQGSFFKSSSLYWTTGNLGWARNMQLFKNAIVGTSLNDEVSMVDNQVKIGPNVTSATLSNYKEYYELAQKAYQNIE